MKLSFVKSFMKVIRMSASIDKLYVPCVLLKSMVKSALPFVSIVYTSRILDGFISKAATSSLLTLAYQLVLIGGLLTVIYVILDYICTYKNDTMNQKLDNVLSFKALKLDYPQLESKEVMEKLQSALDWSSARGGIGSFLDYLGTLTENLITFVYSCVLISGLFIANNNGSSSIIIRILNHPLCPAVLLLLIAASIAYSLMNISKNTALELKLSEDIVNANNVLFYLYEACNNYEFGKDIRIFEMAGLLSEKLEEFSSKSCHSFMNVTHKQGILTAKSKFITQLSVFFSYGVVGLKAVYGLISIGATTRLIGALTLFSTSVTSFIGTLSYISIQLQYMDKYQDFLDTPTEMYHGALPIEKRNDNQYELEFRNVSFHYPNSSELVLNNVSFKMDIGKKLAIVGPNGAGKTTFIKLLCRLYDPTEGEILLNGINIKKYDYQEYSRLFSIVFQDFKLFSASVRDNITGSSPAEEDKLWNCLEKSGVRDRVESMADGIETCIYQNNEQGVEISGGEAQKLAIARALYKSAPIVILDEPTSALDPISEYEIYSRFDSLVEDKTAVYISHRMSSCRFCDNIVVFDKGSIVQVGSHDELVKQKSSLYSKLWESQAQYYAS